MQPILCIYYRVSDQMPIMNPIHDMMPIIGH